MYTGYTETMKIWLRELYLKEAEDHRVTASNCHLTSLGSEGESAAQWEYYAEEHRCFADKLEELAKSIE